ncbi:hypothetical protein [Clostridium sp. MCC353]|uniref:hypothetical protein n=1 Tax=Clostridium sp. MCC353 TaxID=2592646 RepID=UPI002079F3E4|nr:hypothetical protein [Clostridium sp. MCC353]
MKRKRFKRLMAACLTTAMVLTGTGQAWAAAGWQRMEVSERRRQQRSGSLDTG